MTAVPTIRLGTRASALASAQAQWVADRLRATGHRVELVPLSTHGDTSQAPLTQIGGTGVFASTLRAALVRHQIDAAVHSLKDLPVDPEPGLTLAAVPQREDPRDVLVSRDGQQLSELPEGSVVGTGSPRRAAQLRAARPDLQVRPIRGNVDTRLARVQEGSLDAVVLARAGLARLGRLAAAAQTLEPEVMLPAPGQGALAVEVRRGDTVSTRAVQALDDPATRVCVTAERAVLATLQAGCTAPIGALATIEGTGLQLSAFAGREDGTAAMRRTATGDCARPGELGDALARKLLAGGLRELLGEVSLDPLDPLDPPAPDRARATASQDPAAARTPTGPVLTTQLASERYL